VTKSKDDLQNTSGTYGRAHPRFKQLISCEVKQLHETVIPDFKNAKFVS